MEPKTHNATRQATDLIAPWANARARPAERYPGKHRIWSQVLGERVPATAVRCWRNGYLATPQWARDMLANHLRRVGCEHLRIADELTKEKGAP